MRKSVKIGLASAATVALTLGAAGVASADVQPGAKDVVGVGSDTVQYVVDFVADGAPGGAGGYNTLNTQRRVISFDATADAAGVAVYGPNNAAATPYIVLRAKSLPVARPNGSGPGIAALIADSTHKIDFVRSSRMFKATEQTSATAAAGVGAMHAFQIATDKLQVAVSNTVLSNASGVTLTCADLVSIYTGTKTDWSQFTGGTPGLIKPLLPQAGSGTEKDFLADLKACNAGVAPTLTTVFRVEEHDETSIKNDANAIAPFSTGRYNLIQSGYFGTAQPANGIKLLPDATAGGYTLARNLYIIVRDSDISSATGWQVGGSLNWANTLFATGTSWFAKASNGALFTAAGVTQSWADAGVVGTP